MIGEPKVTSLELDRQLEALGLPPTESNRQRLRALLYPVWQSGYHAGGPELQVLNPYRDGPV